MSRKRKPTPRARQPEAEEPGSVVVTLRCPPGVARRLEAHVARLAAQAPGARWTRSSAALNLLVRALDQVEAENRGR